MLVAAFTAWSTPAWAQPLCTAGAHLLHVAAATSSRNLDLLVLGRNVAKAQGMVAAGAAVEDFLKFQDASGGEFEQEIIRAARDASYRVPAALDTLARGHGRSESIGRGNVLFLFVNGLGQTGKSTATRLLNDAVERLQAEGFAAEALRTSPYASSTDNALDLLPQLKRSVGDAAIEHVVVVAVSKGTHELVEALALNEGHPDGLTAGEIGKIRYIVSLSGVVRGSAVAEWCAGSKRVLPRLVRLFMRAPVVGRFPHLEGIRSLASDPSEKLIAADASRHFRCVWVSFAVFPDGADGYPRTGFVRRRILRSFEGSVAVGPYDGLTESASALLPPGTPFEQWIVRVRGAHGMIKGRYVDGTPVVRTGPVSAAWQIVDPLLRTLPVPATTVSAAP